MATKRVTGKTKQIAPARAKAKVSAKVVSPKVTKSTSIATQSKPNISFATLRKWNLGLAGVHFLQAILVLILSTGKGFPVVANFLAVDPLQTAAQGKTVLTSATHHLFDVNLAYIVVTFFLLSALAHLFIATRYRRRYETDLARHVNKARWIEYALSASIMMVAIGLLVGIQDVSLLVTLFGLTAVMNLCGLLMEAHNTPGQPVRWLSYIIGSIAGILPWIVIAIYLVASAVYGSQAPAFVYWIFGSIFVLFSSFAINMLLQHRRVGKWADYLYGERVYMILSLVAKSLLAWQIFAGALRP